MREGRRIYPPECPFCQSELTRPQPGGIGSGSQFYGGVCVCGALFGSDPRGSSLGALLVDVLAFACGGDCDAALELQVGKDFEEAWLYGYHEALHHLVPDTPGPRRGVGTLYLVRLRPNDIPSGSKAVDREEG